MHDIEKIKLLPRIEVSFQDYFAGDEGEFTSTPHYIISKLKNSGYEVKIGDRLLLWEPDEDENGDMIYLCEIRTVIEADERKINEYVGFDIPLSKLASINNIPVIINTEKEIAFDLSPQDINLD